METVVHVKTTEVGFHCERITGFFTISVFFRLEIFYLFDLLSPKEFTTGGILHLVISCSVIRNVAITKWSCVIMAFI